MRRLIRSRLIWISTVSKCMSEFTWCPKLPDFTLESEIEALRQPGLLCHNSFIAYNPYRAIIVFIIPETVISAV